MITSLEEDIVFWAWAIDVNTKIAAGAAVKRVLIVWVIGWFTVYVLIQLARWCEFVSITAPYDCQDNIPISVMRHNQTGLSKCYGRDVSPASSGLALQDVGALAEAWGHLLTSRRSARRRWYLRACTRRWSSR